MEGEHFTSFFFVKLTSEIRDESFINAIIVKLSFKLRKMTMTIRINIGHVPLSMAHYVRVYCSRSVVHIQFNGFIHQTAVTGWRWAATRQYPLYPGLVFSQYDSPISMSALCSVCGVRPICLVVTDCRVPLNTDTAPATPRDG